MQREMSISNEYNASYLVSSVEEGIGLIIDGAPKALLGGRETLYFNMRRYGNNYSSHSKLH